MPGWSESTVGIRDLESLPANARAYLDRFEDIPTVVTPGNHDVPLYRIFERLLDPYRNYKRHIEDRLDYAVDLPGARVVSLNSAAPRARIVNGEYFDSIGFGTLREEWDARYPGGFGANL